MTIESRLKKKRKKDTKRKKRNEYIEQYYVGTSHLTEKITSVEQLSNIVQSVSSQRKTGKRSLHYKMYPGEYDMLLEVQQHKCAICCEPFTKTPHIDHCHTTNTVRALLCSKCNVGLGLFRENVTYLKNAIKYITTFKGSK